MLTLGLAFWQYSGSGGIVPFIRVQNFLIGLMGLYFVPLIWLWVAHRSDVLKVFAGILTIISLFGGIILFAYELLAIPQPVYTYFVDTLDARAEADYWDRLDPGTVVFDPSPFRAPTIFGRPTNASLSMFERKPEWEALSGSPTLAGFKQFGFDYLFFDKGYWDGLQKDTQEELQSPCVKLVKEYTQEKPEDFRRLLDIRGCPQ
jgi:hypothetical protein